MFILRQYFCAVLAYSMEYLFVECRFLPWALKQFSVNCTRFLVTARCFLEFFSSSFSRICEEFTLLDSCYPVLLMWV